MNTIILDSSNIGQYYSDNFLTPKKHFYRITYKGEQLFFGSYLKACQFSMRFCPLAKIEISR